MFTDIFLKYPIDLTQEARILWKPTSNGIFSTKSAWETIRVKHPYNKLLDICWQERVPLTISVFWRKVLHNWLPVEEILRGRDLTLASKCQCCRKKETIHLVIIDNDEVQRVWNWFSSLFQVPIREEEEPAQRFQAWINSSQMVSKGHIRVLIPLLIG